MRIPTSLALLLLLATPMQPSGAATRHVPAQYPTIQAAVNAAQTGDTVLVSGGTYSENVVVSTENIRLEGTNGATLDGTGIHGHGITILADDCTVTGFIVQNYVRLNPFDDPSIGVFVNGVQSSDICDNTLRYNEVGLWIEGLLNSEINQVHHATGNVITGNSIQGATIRGTDGNLQFAFNTVSCNGIQGVALIAANGSKVRQNQIWGNGFAWDDASGAGIFVTLGGGAGLRSSVIKNNDIFGNTWSGVYITLSEDQTVSHNAVCGNGLGIGLDQSLNCTVRQNDVAQSVISDGIFLHTFTTNCTVANNTSNGNAEVGIHVLNLFGGDTTGNTIRNNSAFGNGLYDAADDTGSTPATVLNTWKNNQFGTTNPVGLK